MGFEELAGLRFAGLRRSPGQDAVGIETTICQETPSFLERMNPVEIAFREYNLLAYASLRKHSTGRVGDERAAPKRDRIFTAHAIQGGDKYAVGRRMTDLHITPK